MPLVFVIMQIINELSRCLLATSRSCPLRRASVYSLVFSAKREHFLRAHLTSHGTLWKLWGMVRAITLRSPSMAEVTGIDHIYISVSDLAVSEPFYDRVMVDALGFRKNTFALAGGPHIKYFNRHFGFVLRPARVHTPHEPYAPGLHHFCLRVDSIAE